MDDNSREATVDRLEQGYVVCNSNERFMLLYTFLKKNYKKKKIMYGVLRSLKRVFFSSCNSVKFHSELLNYIDIPVLISTIRDRVGFGYPWQAEAAAKNADLL